MYTLYCRNTAGSMAPEALLEACGADYKVIVLERMADGSFEAFFHRINPKAEVPTLVLPDDSIMTESAAMMIYLADLHPEAGLAPAPAQSPLIQAETQIAAARMGGACRPPSASAATMP
jgi:glutathione S-transferase